MGIGTKIKEALNPDRHNQHTTTTDTTKTPGSFPTEEVPRTHQHDGVYDSKYDSKLDSKADKVSGKHSPEYTYGKSSTTASGPDTLDLNNKHHDDTLSGPTGTAGTTGVHGSNKLTKGHKEPYWGDAGHDSKSSDFGTKTTIGATGATGATGAQDRYGATGAQDRHGNHLDASEINDRYNSSSTQDDYAHGGSRIGRATAGSDTYGHDTSRTGGAASNLTHRPHDTNNTARDYKTEEYDAPTNSSGRGRTAGAVGAGAAAGYGASELSNRHHEHDMREYETAGSPRHGGRSNDNVSATSSMLDPYNQHSNQSTAPTSSSMLDPYNKQSPSSTGHGIMHHHDKHSSAAATGPNTVDPMHHNNNRHSPRDSGFVPGGPRDRSSVGSSNYGQQQQMPQGPQGLQSAQAAPATTMGDDHFGPGHAGAKVHHQCHSCGADNDISKYFRKDAVYRMS